MERTKLKPAGVYLRVSLDRCRHCRRKERRHREGDGKCPGFSPEQTEANQEPDCVRLCEARGWSPVFFRERESGAKDRPEWARLLEACRRGRLRAVVFWALDRVGRSMEQIAHDVKELARYGTDLASVQDRWFDVEARSPVRTILVDMMGWVAEGERNRLIERTKAGQARARAAGKTIGRPRVHATTAQVRKLRAAGLSLRQIAEKLGCSLGTASRRLEAISPQGLVNAVAGGAKLEHLAEDLGVSVATLRRRHAEAVRAQEAA
jgi:DNA invertase Pin-like site-specific DNA recombinase